MTFRSPQVKPEQDAARRPAARLAGSVARVAIPVAMVFAAGVYVTLKQDRSGPSLGSGQSFAPLNSVVFSDVKKNPENAVAPEKAIAQPEPLDPLKAVEQLETLDSPKAVEQPEPLDPPKEADQPPPDPPDEVRKVDLLKPANKPKQQQKETRAETEETGKSPTVDTEASKKEQYSEDRKLQAQKLKKEKSTLAAPVVIFGAPRPERVQVNSQAGAPRLERVQIDSTAGAARSDKTQVDVSAGAARSVRKMIPEGAI